MPGVALRCVALRFRFTDEDYMRKVMDNMGDMASHNPHVWDACVAGPNRNACGNGTFLRQACHRFPVQTMKIVRLRLNVTERLLRDQLLDGLKIVYLVRDPRATINSRLGSVNWCNQSSDCIDPARLCADLHSDLDAFERISALYPDRLALVKYETLANEPQRTLRNVFQFAGLFYTSQIQEMVASHTSHDEEKPWSTVRKSSERVHRWRQTLHARVVHHIQTVCANVLPRLGYAPVSSDLTA